jgi:light-harvesting complex 1 beta chain
MVHIESGKPRPPTTQDVRSDGIIFVLSFVVFLTIALLGQLIGLHWRSWLPGAESAKSIFGGVKAGVYTFMSNLL